MWSVLQILSALPCGPYPFSGCTPIWSLWHFGVHSHMLPITFKNALRIAPLPYTEIICPNISTVPSLPKWTAVCPHLLFGSIPSLLFKLCTNLLNLNPIGYMKSENLSLKLLILYKIVPIIHFLSTLTVFFTVLFYMNAFLFPEWECLCLPLNMIMV